MLPASDHFAGKHVAVLGLGRSGLAAARLARRLGAAVTALDTGGSDSLSQQAELLAAEGVHCLLGDAALACTDHFDLAVLSPAIDPSWPLAQLVLRAATPAISEIEFAFRHTSVPCIAITGTNGKTTTTSLIAAALSAAGLRTVPCGNFGVAFAGLVLEDAPMDVYTLEVSSFQLELIETFRPRVSVWMNFAEDHLDRHPDMDAYYRAKARIFENQTAEDTAVINAIGTYPELKARRVTFSAWTDAADWTLRDGWICLHGEPVLAMQSTRLRGRHNAENLMAALAACHAWGLPLAELAEALRGIPAPRHRCEPAGTVNGVEFINDSKATNVHAMESALRGMESPVVLIAGGKEKGLDYRPLAPLVAEKATAIFTIGEIGPRLADLWQEAAPCTVCASLGEAVRGALAAAIPGQSVLFAPGTSSFDMFTGYDHRGDSFIQTVQQLDQAP